MIHLFVAFWVTSLSWQRTTSRQCDVTSLDSIGRALKNHLITRMGNLDINQCWQECSRNHKCHSINSYVDTRTCELNNATHFSDPEDLVPRHGFVYMLYEFRPFYNCTDTLCGNTSLYQCSVNKNGAGYRCVARVSSCKELKAMISSHKGNKAYPLVIGEEVVEVYCHMDALEGCGPGPWTMVMKVNGEKSTFPYSSAYWTNMESYNVPGGSSGFDDVETKLPTYWGTSFTRICVGFKVQGHVNWASFDIAATSMYHLLKDDIERSAPLRGKDFWKQLIPGSKLQSGCHKEGLNIQCSYKPSAKARVGLVADDHGCGICDSLLGIGTGKYRYTAGNECTYGCRAYIPAIGYIMVS